MQFEGLLEKITGTFLDGTPIGEIPQGARRQRSVVEHIQRLLETRKGSLVHLPDLGLPDIGDLFRRLPGSANEIQAEMESLIGNYEPRMENVKVQFQEFDAARARVRFRVTGSLRGIGRIQLESSFFPNGRGEVRQTR